MISQFVQINFLVHEWLKFLHSHKMVDQYDFKFSWTEVQETHNVQKAFSYKGDRKHQTNIFRIRKPGY